MNRTRKTFLTIIGIALVSVVVMIIIVTMGVLMFRLVMCVSVLMPVPK